MVALSNINNNAYFRYKTSLVGKTILWIYLKDVHKFYTLFHIPKKLPDWLVYLISQIIKNDNEVVTKRKENLKPQSLFFYL